MSFRNYSENKAKKHTVLKDGMLFSLKIKSIDR